MSVSILAVCGSLRSSSVNAEVLVAFGELCPDDVAFIHYNGLGELPPFNPDHDIDPPPPSVAAWRSALQRADAVIISSPEYAHGVPGALKNALDWVVGTGEFMLKPAALISASESSTFVGPQLYETLAVMMARVVPGANITLKLAGKKRDALSLRLDSELAAQMKDVLQALITAIKSSE